MTTLAELGDLSVWLDKDGTVGLTRADVGWHEESEETIALSLDEARWLFAVAGPSVLIAIGPHAKRGER